MCAMHIFCLLCWFLCFVKCRYLPAATQNINSELDESILDEVFDKLQYEDKDDAIEEVDYNYYYYDDNDDDQSSIPGKAGKDFPVYDDVPDTQVSCKGDTIAAITS